MSVNIEQIAKELDQAARNATPLSGFSDDTPFTVDEAYQIQRASIQRRYDDGERRVGVKLGFTSRAKMQQMGVDSLIWGWLTDKMRVNDGGDVVLSNYIHPRAEPEVCFLVGKDIDHPLSQLETAQYLDAVAPAIEIIDSRYENFKFTLATVVADNCSSAGVVVGPWSRDFSGLANAGTVLRSNGQTTQAGSTAAILGNPLRTVEQVSQLVTDAKLTLPAGSLIMAGGATAAEALTRGSYVDVQISGLGSCGFNCV